MRVVILGAGTAIPAGDYSPSGIYIQAGREHLLFDAGPGTAQRLRAAGVSIFDLDRIFLTHYHLDHCLDLASILFALRIPRLADSDRRGGPRPIRTKSLVVYGPPGLKKLYRQLNHAFHGWLTPRSFGLALKELKETTLRLPGYTVASRWMNHSAPALGYRVEAGSKRLAYSGDTDVCWGIVELGRNTHLLILECSVTDERKVEGHLTPTACGRIAEQANCRHLALTHFYPVFKGYDIRKRVRRHFHGRLTLARDLTALTV